MSERPVVSTLTSCFHGEKYLPLFLEKMPEQKAFDRLEVVIDLNEPSAEELRLVRQFQERYPGHLRYTVQNKVVTYSASWNNCIRNSTGEYLAVWNIDDLRPEDSIEKQAALLDANPEIGIVHGKYTVVPRFGDMDGDVFRNYRPVENWEATRRFIFGAFYMFRKSLVEKAGYVDEQFRSSADFDHTLRLSLHTRSAVVDGNLGYYYMANTGLSNNPNSRIDVENFVIRMRYGIYDKLWFHYLAAASDYDIYRIQNGNEWIHVSKYVPDYRAMLERRYRMWFDRGYLRHLAFKVKKENFSGIRGVLTGLRGRDEGL
ncbi:MAG: putative glycosyl transferase [Methanomassiliicoccales archaeon PtaB.Bin134]|nr:MAG: putative glycosyl transferase [Methanomassiliicoccales archaeon PtaB.Bin134]